MESPPPPKPQTTWFQFHLRLLILVVVGVNTYWWVNRAFTAEVDRRLAVERQANEWAEYRGWLRKLAAANRDLEPKPNLLVCTIPVTSGP